MGRARLGFGVGVVVLGCQPPWLIQSINRSSVASQPSRHEFGSLVIHSPPPPRAPPPIQNNRSKAFEFETVTAFPSSRAR
jgi:hypothetical protein